MRSEVAEDYRKAAQQINRFLSANNFDAARGVLSEMDLKIRIKKVDYINGRP